MIYNETPEKAYIPIISHVSTKDIAITAMIIYIDEREREREGFTEKIGVFEVFGANEKNFKRSLWHLWREVISWVWKSDNIQKNWS